MTREDLKKIVEGITDEQLKSILDIHSADIGKAKKDYDTIKGENDTLKSEKKQLEDKVSELADSENDAAEYKKQLDELKADIKSKEDAAAAEKADREQTEAIEAVIGDRKFTSEYVRAGIIADMKSAIAKPENVGKGYDKILDDLTKDKDGIFANPNPPAPIPGMGNPEPSGGGDGMKIPKLF